MKNKPRRQARNQTAPIGGMLLTGLKFLVMLAILTGLVDYYIYLNQKIAETERAILNNRQQLSRTIREIEQLRIHKEQLSAWPHIREMILRFDLDLREPAPGQVANIAVLSPAQAAVIPLENAANFNPAAPAPGTAPQTPLRRVSRN